MNQNHVLVLGGSYFIGRCVTEALAAAGYTVYTLNRGTKPKVHEAVHEIICDRNDAAAMKAALAGHTFAHVIDISGLNRAQAQNLTGALRAEHLQSFIFLSSSAVYAMTPESPAPTPIPETAPLGPNTYWDAYGTDKIQAEAHYQSWAPCPLTILRPPYVYGEYNYARRESWVYRHLQTSRPILLPAKNSQLQFIYVRDLARLIVAILQQPQPGIYNVGSPCPVTMREWLHTCGKAANQTPLIAPCTLPEARRYFPFHDYDNVLDVSSIHALYNIEETPFEEGLRQAYAWYLKHQGEIEFNPAMDEIENQYLSECL